MGRRIFRHGPKVALVLGSSLLAYALIPAQQPSVGDDHDTVIGYTSNVGLADAVTKLQADLNSGKTTLDYEPEHGYLISVLKQLNIPVDSQLLVWSKTSSQANNTSPETPRALYFNQDVYVGWAQHDDLLDLIAMDPVRGPIFFTLKQTPTPKPTFVRDETCMVCHYSPKTLNVPGLIIRSVYAKPDGHAIAQLNTFVAGHNNPLSQRWGGWYVTGTHGSDTHMGNAFLAGQDPQHLNLAPTSNITDLSTRFDTSKYLTNTSDTIALMVLDDAVRMDNMITRATYEGLHEEHDPPLRNEPANYRQQMIVTGTEPLVAYMLFRDEAPLKGPIKGTTDYAEEFEKQGPRDSKGRSLREFDLNTRLFRYPCNYRIYSEQFDAMPQITKAYVWKRLDEVLTGKDQTRLYAMAPDDRKNVLEILLDTKPEFKAWMTANDPANA